MYSVVGANGSENLAQEVDPEAAYDNSVQNYVTRWTKKPSQQ